MGQFQTFFGIEAWKVFGIEALPFTPITEALLHADWVSYSFPQFQKACDTDIQCKQQGWTSFVYLTQAIIDTSAAWQSVLNQPASAFSKNGAGTDGNSRTNSLYWVATRPQQA